MKKQRKSKPSVLILDIDGCLNIEYPSLVLNKNPEIVAKDPYGEAVWELFKDSAHNLKSRPQFLPFYHFQNFKNTFDKIYVVSARLEDWRSSTEKWLAKWGFEYDRLFLRPTELMRLESHKFKRTVLDKYILKMHKSSDCVACDDDKSICVMYEEVGIRAYQAPLDWENFLVDFNFPYPKLGENHKTLLNYYLKIELKKGKTISEISRELGVNYRTLTNFKSKLKVETKPALKKVNIAPFKELDTPEAAYLTGLVNSVELKLGTRVGSVAWTSNDIKLLKSIAKQLKVDNSIKLVAKKTGLLSVNQLSFANILLHRWGLTTDSQKRKFPKKVPEKMLSHFLRGCFDRYGKIQETEPFDLVFMHSDGLFLEQLKECLKSLGFRTVSVTNVLDNHLLFLEGLEEVTKFYKLIYKNATLFDSYKKLSFDAYLILKRKKQKGEKAYAVY